MAKRSKHKKLIPTRIWIAVFALLIVFFVVSAVVTRKYTNDLKPVNTSAKSQIIVLKSGSSVKEISTLLQKNKLIRSSWAMQLYVDTMNYGNSLQAGTYALAPDESTQDIVKTIVSGNIKTDLVTIIPGLRIDQVTNDLINDGYSQATVTSALTLANYSNLPIASIVPSNVTSIEGLLWPDSFERTNSTPLSTIITESLNEMDSHLTPSVQSAFASEGLSTYQGLTLASIVDQEVSKPLDQTKVAQVFLSRLKNGSDLQSDVTAFYGAIEAGQSPSVRYPSLYNTYMHSGLPPTPISTISQSSLNAAAHPANTNWAYFVTGDNGVTYFANTLVQQQSNTANYCHKLCSQ